MASYTTAWIIGAQEDLNLAVSIDASPQTITGDLYLYHATSTLSLLGMMVTKMTAAGVGAAAAVLTGNRRVKLSSNATFTVTWTSTDLRDMLGFTGNLAGASSYTATNVSPLLWSPAKPLTPELSPTGVVGIRRPLAFFTQSPSDGSAFVVSHGRRTDQRWSCSHVAVDRFFTSSLAGGEYVKWFEFCAAKGFRWYVFPEVVEDASSTSATTLTGELGPYVLAPAGRAPSVEYRRAQGLMWLGPARADVTIACRDAPEYT